MKNLLLIIIVASLAGCGSLNPVTALRRAVQPGTGDNPRAVSSTDPSAKPHKPTATEAAVASPVAAVAAHIVHLMETAGVCCLLAGSGLIYFGQVIPGVKCVLSGVALPVCAVWFNYHYGLVIGGILISSAAGFLWAVSKKHPEYLAGLESKFALKPPF